VRLDPRRALRDADAVMTDVVQHFTSLVNADVEITLEIEGRIPGGAPDNVVRTVTANAACCASRPRHSRRTDLPRLAQLKTAFGHWPDPQLLRAP